MLKRFYLGFSLEDSGFANLDGPFSNSSVEAAFIPMVGAINLLWVEKIIISWLRKASL